MCGLRIEIKIRTMVRGDSTAGIAMSLFSVLQCLSKMGDFQGRRNEAEVAAFTHDPADPPVVVEFLDYMQIILVLESHQIVPQIATEILRSGWQRCVII